MDMNTITACGSKEIKRLSSAIAEILEHTKQIKDLLQDRIDKFIFFKEKKEKVISETPQKPRVDNIISQMFDDLTEINEILHRHEKTIDEVLTEELKRL